MRLYVFASARRSRAAVEISRAARPTRSCVVGDVLRERTMPRARRRRSVGRRRRPRRGRRSADAHSRRLEPRRVGRFVQLQRRRHHRARRRAVHGRARRALRGQRGGQQRPRRQCRALGHMGLLGGGLRRSQAVRSARRSERPVVGGRFSDGDLRRAHRRRPSGLRRLSRRQRQARDARRRQRAAGGYTELKYTTPIVVLQFPLSVGTNWTSESDVSGVASAASPSSRTRSTSSPSVSAA